MTYIYEICGLPHVQGNSFQAVVVTNGVLSYAVFTYQCGELNWVQFNSASIGFSASSTSFANHPFSQQPNVNDIACLSQRCPPWTNVVYQISKKQNGTMHVWAVFVHSNNYGTIILQMTSAMIVIVPFQELYVLLKM